MKAPLAGSESASRTTLSWALDPPPPLDHLPAADPLKHRWLPRPRKFIDWDGHAPSPRHETNALNSISAGGFAIARIMAGVPLGEETCAVRRLRGAPPTASPLPVRSRFREAEGARGGAAGSPAHDWGIARVLAPAAHHSCSRSGKSVWGKDQGCL